MLRAAATPEQFLGSRGSAGLLRFISRLDAVSPRGRTTTPAALRLAREPRAAFSIELPRDLVQLFEFGCARPLGDFIPAIPKHSSRSRTASRALALTRSLLSSPRRSTRQVMPRASHAHASAPSSPAQCRSVPHGAASYGSTWSAAHQPLARRDRDTRPGGPAAPRLAFRDASTFALACALDASAAAGEDASRVNELRTRLPSPGVAEQEGVRAAFERAVLLLELLTATDAGVRRAARKLAPRPFEPPHPPTKVQAGPSLARRPRDTLPPSSATRMHVAKGDRAEPLALGRSSRRSSARRAASSTRS